MIFAFSAIKASLVLTATRMLPAPWAPKSADCPELWDQVVLTSLFRSK